MLETLDRAGILTDLENLLRGLRRAITKGQYVDADRLALYAKRLRRHVPADIELTDPITDVQHAGAIVGLCADLQDENNYFRTTDGLVALVQRTRWVQDAQGLADRLEEAWSVKRTADTTANGHTDCAELELPATVWRQGKPQRININGNILKLLQYLCGKERVSVSGVGKAVWRDRNMRYEKIKSTVSRLNAKLAELKLGSWIKQKNEDELVLEGPPLRLRESRE